MAAQAANQSKKGASRFSLKAPMVAGACNAPNALIVPFRIELSRPAA
jgi:hypothetical protein